MKHSDLPERGPGRHDRGSLPGGLQRLGLMGVEPLDAHSLQCLEHLWMQLCRQLDQARFDGALTSLAHEPAILSAGIEQLAPGLYRALDGWSGSLDGHRL